MVCLQNWNSGISQVTLYQRIIPQFKSRRISMQYTLYEQVRYWLPMISAFGLVIGAWRTGKKNLSEFCDTLLTNHLSHIQTATQSTEVETKKTNGLLSGQSGKLDMVQGTLNRHYEQQLQVWDGVVKTLAILEDRTRARKTTPKRKARHA
jgi:hypothetical protein